MTYTANLFTAKTAGFHCVQFPTAVSLNFLQSYIAYSGSLHSNLIGRQPFNFCSLMTAISAI